MKKIFKDEKLKRAMEAFDCKKVKDFAMLFDMSPQNLNGYIDRGTFIEIIKAEVFKRGIDLNWIKTGEGSMTKADSSGAEPQPAYARAVGESPPENLGELIKQTTEVLLSDTNYATALKENIKAFHEAVNERKKLTDPPDAATDGSESSAAVKKAAR